MTTWISKLSKWTGEKTGGFIEQSNVRSQHIKTVDTDLTNLFLSVQRLQNFGFSFAFRTGVNDVAYSASGTDVIIAYTALSAGRTVTLPAASTVSGKIFIVKDEAGGAAANNITIATVSGTIDGAATNVISANYGAVRVYSNGTNYFLW